MPEEKKSIKAWAKETGVKDRTANNYFWYYTNEVGEQFQITAKGYLLTKDEWSRIVEHGRNRLRARA